MISPNPFDNFLISVFEEGTTFPIEMTVSSSAGRVVLRERIFTSKKIISTSDLIPGLYHIRLENEHGELLDGHFRKQ
jgi:hypothetical protein